MCGRALEGICRHFKTKSDNLANGLTELRDARVIDGRLFDWSEELRKHRNLGAHASEERISSEDAADLLDFAHAITTYVFDLTAKFKGFLQRKTAMHDK